MYMITCHMAYFSNISQTQQIMLGSLQLLPIGYRLFWFVTRLTRPVPLVEQEMITLPEPMSSAPVCSGFVLFDL